MEEFTRPVEGQHDGQKTEAERPLPIRAGRIRYDTPSLHRFVVQRLRLTADSRKQVCV